MDVRDRVVFVTGSSRGIGLAIAHRFAQEGSRVVLNSRSPIAEEILAEFSAYAHPVLAVTGDVAQPQDVESMVAQVLETWGPIEILVNNAGITKDKLTLKLSPEDFSQVLEVNLLGAFHMTQAVLKSMTKAREGAIINVSSVVGLMGNVGQSNYAASKAGLIGFSKSVAREVAARNVRVNVLAPGMVESDMTQVLPERIKEATLAQIPMKRFGSPREVADVALFLAQQDYLTGQVLALDGGLSM